MDVRRRRKVRDIFEQLSLLEGESRTAFLDKACGSDADLKQAVLTLVEGGPPLDLEVAHPSHLDTGSMVGGYCLQDLQYENEQFRSFRARGVTGPFRSATVKVVKAGILPGLLTAVLQQEQELLHRLEHRHIARFYECGALPGGGPWFAHEYVPGQSLRAYCAAHQVSLDDRLDIFTKVCEGVAAGHRLGVIHGELHPENIHIDRHHGGAQPKILGFGIARAFRGAQNRLSGQVPFLNKELDYQAPEQGRGEPSDTRTDVYALGALLYRLICEREPSQRGSALHGLVEEGQLRVLEDRLSPYERLRQNPHVAKVSARAMGHSAHYLLNRLSGDLSIIVGKCLMNDPAQRYPSVQALMDDLWRLKHKHPIRAKEESLSYRLSCFFKRHKLATFGLIATLLILSSSLYSFYKDIQLMREDKAHSVEAMHATWARLDGLPILNEEIGQQYPLPQSKEQTLYTQVREPTVGVRIHQTLARYYLQANDINAAARHAQDALDLGLSDSVPEGDQLATRVLLARIDKIQGKHSLAVAKARALSKEAQELALIDSRIEAQYILADGLVHMGQVSRAKDLIKQTRQLLEGRPGRKHWDLALDLTLANAHGRARQFDRADKLLSRLALEAQREDHRLGVQSLLVKNALAWGHHKRAIELLSELIPDLESYGAELTLAQALSWHGHALLIEAHTSPTNQQSKLDQAETALRLAIFIHSANMFQNNPKALATRGAYWSLYGEQGCFAAAATGMGSVIESHIQLGETPTREIIALKTQWADLLMGAEHYEAAIGLLGELLAHQIRVRGSQSPESISLMTSLTRAHMALGALNEAERVASELLNLWPQNSEAVHMLGLIRAAQGQHTIAESLLHESLDLHFSKEVLEDLLQLSKG